MKNTIIFSIFLFFIFLPCCLFLTYADTQNDISPKETVLIIKIVNIGWNNVS